MAFTSGVPAALQPSQTKALYAGNYIDFTAAGFSQWTQQVCLTLMYLLQLNLQV